MYYKMDYKLVLYGLLLLLGGYILTVLGAIIGFLVFLGGILLSAYAGLELLQYRREGGVIDTSFKNEIVNSLHIGNLLRSFWFWMVCPSAIIYVYVLIVYGRYWATIALNALVVIVGGIVILLFCSPFELSPKEKYERAKIREGYLLEKGREKAINERNIREAFWKFKK